MPVSPLSRKSVSPIAVVGLCVIAGLAGFAVARRAGAEAPLPRLVPLLSAGTTVTGETVNYPEGVPAKVTAAILTLMPGDETGWHTHGVPAFGYVLDGELTVDYGDKGRRTYKAGDALLEAMTVAHNGRNSGSEPMRILAVFMGVEGAEVSTKVEK